MTGASIYFLIYKLQDFMCPNYTTEVESYPPVSRVIDSKYVDTLENYLMDNAAYYHLTQVFTYDQSSLTRRFIKLLRRHYIKFAKLEDSDAWNAELIGEIKSNFTNSSNGDTHLVDKVILYKIQEMVAQELEYQACFSIEMGMTDFLRNYSTQALLVWYHWRGLIIETDLIPLHNYVSQKIHSTVLSQASLCTDDQMSFHYYAVNKNAVKEEYRDRYQLVYRVPCFPLSYFTAHVYRAEHIEYFIVGPRCDLIIMLNTILKYKNMHFVLIIFDKKVTPDPAALQLMKNNYFSVFYKSENQSRFFTYILFFKFIERKHHLI